MGTQRKQTKYMRVLSIILSTLCILKLFFINLRLIMVHNLAAEIGGGGGGGCWARENPEIMRNLLQEQLVAQLSSKGGNEDDLRQRVKVGRGHRDGEGPAGEDFLSPRLPHAPAFGFLFTPLPLALLIAFLPPSPPSNSLLPPSSPSLPHPSSFTSSSSPLLPHHSSVFPPPPFPASFPGPGAQPRTGGPPSWFLCN